MTVSEVKNLYEGQYTCVEVYEAKSKGENYPYHFHTDNCYCVEERADDEVGFYELMDEETYEHSILATANLRANFEDWYGNKDAKVLCMMLAD